jgi:prepilin-type N-terminal cleavage/methylation domain-containing protein
MHFKMVRGFTLVELLVVISIIGLLAALTLGGVKAVQDKAAKARAQGEIAAIEVALERYKIDNGDYPDGDQLTPTADLYPANYADNNYKAAGKDLFLAITGRSKYGDPSSGTTQYIELKKNQTYTDLDGKSYIQDPWGSVTVGHPYGYYYKSAGSVNGNVNAKSLFNEVTPDIWSTANKKTAALNGADKANYLNWVTNWSNK